MQKIMMLLMVSCSMLNATRFSPDFSKPDPCIIQEKIDQLRYLLSKIKTVEEKDLEGYFRREVFPNLSVSAYSNPEKGWRALIEFCIKSNITFLERQLSFRPTTPITSPRRSSSPFFP